MSTQVFTTATAKILGPKLPIIVVPGIGGSRLTDPANGQLIWNPMGGPLGDPGDFAAVTARMKNVNTPLIADETHKFTHVADQVAVDPINHFYNLIAAFYGDLSKALQFDLAKQLTAKRLTPAVYCCGYDWRGDNHASAQRLSNIVDEAQGDCDGAKVIIVAHSMGGIVSRDYCKNLGGESKVRAMILLGSPTLGAVSAYENMRNGLPFFDKLRRVLNVGGGESRTLMRSMQAVYQLLPTFIYCSLVQKSWATFDASQTGWPAQAPAPQIDAMKISDNSNNAIFYNDIYCGLRDDPADRDAVSTQVGTAFQFHGTISSADFKQAYVHPKTIAFFGTGGQATTRCNIAFGGIVQAGNDWVVSSTVTASKGDGDTTVPTDSAHPAPVTTPFDGASRGFPGVGHVDLSSNAGVIGAVRDAIVNLV